MKPYYQDDYATLYHADSLTNPELWLTADVLITDPPYGINYVSGYAQVRRDNIANDESTAARDAVLDAWGIRPWAAFGTWKQARPQDTAQVLIWDKTPGGNFGMGDLNLAFGLSHEEIYLSKGWLKRGRRHGSVLPTTEGIGSLASATGHPTPKPVSLLGLLISAAPPGIIADPFAGSGSTMVAAKRLGRHVIGVEIDERYCEIAARRLAQDSIDFGGAA